MASLRHLLPLHTSNPKLEFPGTGLNGARTGVNFVIWHCFSLVFLFVRDRIVNSCGGQLLELYYYTTRVAG